MDRIIDEVISAEQEETSRRVSKGKPIYARLDGSNFSKFTKKMTRPYDERLSRLMITITRELMERTGASFGYTQSDEISLGFLYESEEEEQFFGGRIQKMNSILAGMTSALFLQKAMQVFPDLVEKQMPYFDARVFSVESPEHLVACFQSRMKDGRRNAVSMAARAVFSHGELQGRSTRTMTEMLAIEGVDFRDYPEFFRAGTLLRRTKKMINLSAEELARIPEKYRPYGPVERTVIESLEGFSGDYSTVPERMLGRMRVNHEFDSYNRNTIIS